MPKKTSKHRIEFKKNRAERTRKNDWTQNWEEHGTDGADHLTGERISGKGDLVRKRTIVGQLTELDSDSGERGDFRIVPEVDLKEVKKGRVLKVHGLYSYVEDESNRIYTCTIRRILKTISTDQRQIVVAGDHVWFRDAYSPARTEGVIERVESRRGTISRTSRHRKHIMVTNVDQAVIVTSVAEPHLKPNLIDRLLVTCERAGISPIICINKIDLIEPESIQPLVGVYSQMGYPVIPVSTKTGLGIDRIRDFLQNCESVVVGQSGVGKSSILNAIDPQLRLRVNEVSLVNQKGKHTTTTAELIHLSFGGYVVDTPGIREFMLWDFVPQEVIGFFRDLRPFENRCHYPDCTHIHEEICAVKEAVADGRLDLRRYESYLSLRCGDLSRETPYEQ